MIELGGAYFPAWLLAMIFGLIGASLLRLLLMAWGFDAYLQPRPLAYPAMGLLLALGFYLLFFAP